MSGETSHPANRWPPGWARLAFGWGFAEATFFFIVPDVLTSRLVLANPHRGFQACAWALAGAVPGGLLLFGLARDPVMAAALLTWFDCLPGISPALIEKARLGLHSDGNLALFQGAMAGVPYKLYAVLGGEIRLPLVSFLVASAAARVLRFTLVTALSWLVGVTLLRPIGLNQKLWLHAALWGLFYAGYFTAMAR